MCMILVKKVKSKLTMNNKTTQRELCESTLTVMWMKEEIMTIMIMICNYDVELTQFYNHHVKYGKLLDDNKLVY